MQAEIQQACEHIGYQRTDQGDTDQGGKQRIFYIACTAQTAAVNDLGNLYEHDDHDIAGDQHAHIDGRRITEVEREQESAAEEEYDCENDGDNQTDLLADPSVFDRLLFDAFTQGTSGQCNRGDLHSVAECKSERQEVHAYLVGRKRIRAESCGDDSRCHEADAHCHVFNKEVGTETIHGAECLPCGTDMHGTHDGDGNKTVFGKQGADTHEGGRNGSEYGCDSGTVNPPFREAEVASDEQIVEDNINDAGHNVGRHGDPRIAGAALCGVDNQREHIEERSAHNDAEINHRRTVRIGI